MDDQGNILVKRVSKCNVYVKSTSAGEETSIGAEVLKLPNCALEPEKPVKVRSVTKSLATRNENEYDSGDWWTDFDSKKKRKIREGKMFKMSYINWTPIIVQSVKLSCNIACVQTIGLHLTYI